jgi:branched-subunit amino acid aminotransferase/4-amino-4-deoxychorismate lyase
MESKLWMAGGPRAPEGLRDLAGRAIRYGDGVFVTLGCENGILLDARAQLARLAGACERVGLPVPTAVASVAALAGVLHALGADGLVDFVARVQVSAGPSARGYGRASDVESWELVELSGVPPSRACRVAIAGPEMRLPLPALPDVKSCSALAHVLASRAASRLGVDELVRTADGLVTEATAANVFWSSGDVLYTPAASLPFYAGVTRAVVLQVAPGLGLAVDDGEHAPASLQAADGVFLTNAARGVEIVTEIDGTSVGWPESLARLAAAVADARQELGERL